MKRIINRAHLGVLTLMCSLIWCIVYSVECKAQETGDRRQAIGIGGEEARRREGEKAMVYQTKAIGQGIRSLRVETEEVRAKREEGIRVDPTRVYLTLPGGGGSGNRAAAGGNGGIGENGVIDGTEAGNTLSISFDEMSHDMIQYAYTVYHLSSDFQIDELQSFEYLKGFTRGDILDYTTSMNTAVNYTHYAFSFPNEDMQICISGNYLIKIYEATAGEERTVATVVFQVVEPLVGLSANVTPNTIKEISGRYQQVDIDLGTDALHVVSPEDIKLLVRQNGRIDNQVYAPYPSYIEPSRLRWKDHKALVFEGGNEYRHMDIWSTYFAGYHVDKIRYQDGQYHAILMPDKVMGTLSKDAGRCGVSYMHEYDHNGMMTINAERCQDIDTEAEYMYVHWTLPMETPIMDAIYIGGDIFAGQMENGLNRMLYDTEAQCYYMNALVKQGGYDYQYWVKRKGEPSATLLETEGSHWETENVYTIYIYFRSVSDRYDRLVGIYSSSST